MPYTLADGQFELGSFVGRGTILGGESYDNTKIQQLLTTAGLVGIASSYVNSIYDHRYVFFRESTDPVTGILTTETDRYALYREDGAPSYNIQSQARYYLAPKLTDIYNFYRGYSAHASLNSASGNSVIFIPPNYVAGTFLTSVSSSNWRFLARDYATAKTQYPSTTEEGSIFAAAYVNSPTQWGLFAAGNVGKRSGYFNKRQGDFAIVLLQNGGNSYFSVMSVQTENSTARNDSPLRNFNIVPVAGQTTVNDQMCELLLLKDTGNNFSIPLGVVPGLFYIDPNKAGFENFAIGDSRGSLIDIDPDPNSTFEGRDRALVVAQWGSDVSLSLTNSGNVFTVGGTPHRRTLENGVRLRFTAAPPGGFSTGVDYWVINWNETAFTFNLASTEGGGAVTATGNTSSTVLRKAALIAMRCY